MNWRVGRGVFLATGLLLLLPIVAAAQSEFSGVVKDESNAVLPGVTVEASSPVLIEKVKSATTDSQGRYSIVDLRPGEYKLTFTLTGFATIVRDGIQLPSNFVATVNVEMKVGSLEETITVSGQMPVVDVQQAAHTQVLTRDLLDTLPSARTLQTIGQQVPGVKISAPDVGGTRMTSNTGQRAHGVAANNNTSQVDGMIINSSEGNGGNLGYLNDALNAEVSITTYALPAEVSGGGVRINSIPKDGGNSFSGSVFLGGTMGKWVGNNLDRAKLQNVATPQTIISLQNFNAALGGPIFKNKLWFFLSPRDIATNLTTVNVVKADGTPLVDDQNVKNITFRLTGQLNSKNKIAAVMDRVFKRRGTISGIGIDPAASQTRSPHNGIYLSGQSKWTSTLTNKILLEAGYSTYLEHYRTQPINGFPLTGSPEWLADARKQGNVLTAAKQCTLPTGCTVWGTDGADTRTEGDRRTITTAASYVTGSHNMKAGFQLNWGRSDAYADQTAGLTQTYVNGSPSQVIISNTPRLSWANVKYDLGVYMQDTWTLKRLTFNPGLRIENFNSYLPDQSMSAGRFVPARFYPAVHNLPNWNGDVAPRVSAAYDVFGNGSTAIKASVSRYYESWFGGFASRYSSVASSTSTYNWTDLNVDDIAQENEFINNPGSNANFGKTTLSRAPDPNEKRSFNMEYTLQAQREVIRGVSVNLGYFRRTWHNSEASHNTLTSQADWTSAANGAVVFQVANPLNPSQMINAYQLNPVVRSLSFTQDYTNPAFQSIYDGIELSWQARLHNGISAFGGWTMERNLTVDCGASDDPNGNGTDKFNAYPIARGLQVGPDGKPWCDQTKLSIPFVNEIKFAGNLPLWYGVDMAAALQSLPGAQYAYTYVLQNAAFPGKTNVGTAQTLLLSQPGSLYYPRLEQLDVNFKKNFRFHAKTFTAQVDLFNVTNSNTILTKNTAVQLTGAGTVNTSLNDVSTFLTARTVRLAFQMRF